jgi:hypothetical protein
MGEWVNGTRYSRCVINAGPALLVIQSADKVGALQSAFGAAHSGKPLAYR